MTIIEAPTPQNREITRRYEFMIETVRLLGERAWKHINNGIEMELKQDGTKVTTADITLNEDFIELAAKLDPSDLVWGEERSNGEKGDTNAADKAWTWLIDPIDGTSGFWRSYMQRNFSDSTANIMVAGFAPGETTPTMSVMSNPFNRQRTMIASVGGKALYYGHRLREPRQIQLQPSPDWPRRIEDVRRFEDGYWSGGTPDLRTLRALMPQARRVNHALFMAATALGDVDLSAFCAPSNPHDVAPGAAIVHSAGGVVTTFKKEPYESIDWRVFPVNGVVAASNRELAEDLVDKLA